MKPESSPKREQLLFDDGWSRISYRLHPNMVTRFGFETTAAFIDSLLRSYENPEWHNNLVAVIFSNLGNNLFSVTAPPVKRRTRAF